MGERREEKVKAIKEIFEVYAREYVALLNKYAAERVRLWNEIKDDDELEEALYKLEEEGQSEIGELQKKYEERLRALDLEVEWNTGEDGWNYFSAPGYSYNVCIDYHHVVDRNAKKVHLVVIWYLELNRPGETEYKLEDVVAETHELIDEEGTPFAAALAGNIDWTTVRKVWLRNIEDLVEEVALGERRGRLEETLKEVKERAEEAAWVYEYKNFLAALYKTAEEFNIQL